MPSVICYLFRDLVLAQAMTKSRLSSDNFALSNTAFVIGNSSNPFLPPNAMKVLFDGTTTIADDLTINSDLRLKSNVKSLGSTLSLLRQIDGKVSTIKNNESKGKIGLIAQEVQKIFPQLVQKGSDKQEMLSLNYQGLIPVLINAVNEQ